MPMSLRKLPKTVFKRKIKQRLFEILASEDCYIDLPVIIQKVKLSLFSSQYDLVCIINIIFKNIIFVYLQSLVVTGKLPFVIPLVYQWSLQFFLLYLLLITICNTVSLLVVLSNCCQFQSPQSSCCFQLYLVIPSCLLIIFVNMTRLDQHMLSAGMFNL